MKNDESRDHYIIVTPLGQHKYTWFLMGLKYAHHFAQEVTVDELCNVNETEVYLDYIKNISSPWNIILYYSTKFFITSRPMASWSTCSTGNRSFRKLIGLAIGLPQ